MCPAVLLHKQQLTIHTPQNYYITQQAYNIPGTGHVCLCDETPERNKSFRNSPKAAW